MFGRFKGRKSTIHSVEDVPGQKSTVALASTHAVTAPVVDPSCNTTITVTCLKQLYNAVNYTVKAAKNNSVALTGYLEQFANIQDLQSFYAAQVPEAVGTNFTVISVKGTRLR